MRSLRIGFVVQGEGRGHMTQALALAAFLRDAGHEIARVWVGTSPHRGVPEYFSQGIGAPLETFEAPVQVPDRARVAASPARTVADAIVRAPAFARAASRIHEGTRRLDLVVNFLDLVTAASRVLLDTPTPAVAVAHNYVFLLPDAHPLPGPTWLQRAVLGWTRATSARCSIRLALSFGPRPGLPRASLEVVPPLLRRGLDEVEVRDDGFLLAYALNPGYGNLLAAWQRDRPDVRVRCYVEGGGAALRPDFGPGFEPRPLDQEGFLSDLGRCHAFVGSAGFETLCEALYLGKRSLAVPTAGQYEQVLNAWDAERHGAARSGSYADLDAFWDETAGPADTVVSGFRAWTAEAPERHVGALERASRSGRRSVHSVPNARGPGSRASVETAEREPE